MIASDVRAHTQRLASHRPADRVLKLIKLLIAPLRNILRDSEDRKIGSGKRNVIVLCQRIRQRLWSRRKLCVQPNFRYTKLVDQIGCEYVRPRALAEFGRP